jgi:Tellurite resistance protein TerB
MERQRRLSSARARPRRKDLAPAPSERWVVVAPREDEMLDRLDRRERLRLVEFVCSFAWADFQIQPEERAFITRLIRRLELDGDERQQVEQWLERPPRIENLDPTAIPPAHRRDFVEAIEGLIASDGAVHEEEQETFEVFKQLLVG